MAHQYAWGGRSMPQLMIPLEGRSLIWILDEKDGIKLKCEWLPVGKRIIETEWGVIRYRIRGYRLRATITFECPLNAQFVEYLRILLNNRVAYIRPHPNELVHADNHALDYWKVVPESDFDPEYFNDRFIGHKGTLILLSQDIEKELPVDVTGAIFGC